MEKLPTLVHCSDLMSHPHRLPLPLCFASTEARLLIRDGGGVVVGGGGDESVKARPRAPTRKTEEAVDRRQNNGSV